MGHLVVVNRPSLGVGFRAQLDMKIEMVEQVIRGAKRDCGARRKYQRST